MRALAVTTVLACSLLLAGCGGDDDGADDPTPSASTSRTASEPVLTSDAPTPTAASSPGDTNIAGDWTGSYQSTKYPTTSGDFTVTFTQTGTRISGSITVSSDCIDEGTISGQLTGSTITFGAVKAAETIDFDGSIAGDSMRGNYHSGPACGDDDGTWAATRR